MRRFIALAVLGYAVLVPCVARAQQAAVPAFARWSMGAAVTVNHGAHVGGDISRLLVTAGPLSVHAEAGAHAMIASPEEIACVNASPSSGCRNEIPDQARRVATLTLSSTLAILPSRTAIFLRGSAGIAGVSWVYGRESSDGRASLVAGAVGTALGDARRTTLELQVVELSDGQSRNTALRLWLRRVW